jgi:transcriptional regulator with XRE-family HTH domain
MTPFGERMRTLRTARGLTQQQQADQLGVSKAYISALETGARGQPSAPFVDQICAWLGLIWDDAEELKALAALSHPKPSIDTSRSHAAAVELANLMATHIGALDPAACRRLIDALQDELYQSGR